MADQLRWFKVWTTLLIDMDNLPDEAIGRWTRLGCRTAAVGTNGTTVFASRGHLAAFLKVSEHCLEDALNMLPNVRVEEGKNRDGSLAVTFNKWHKYQSDSTAAQRMRSLRSKRRGEEIREEEIRKETTPLPPKGIRRALRAHKPEPEEFTRFWNAYPSDRRKGRQEAIAAWRSLRLTPAQVEQVTRSLASWTASPDWRKENGKYIPWPQKFLRKRRWEETVEAQPDELDFLRTVPESR